MPLVRDLHIEYILFPVGGTKGQRRIWPIFARIKQRFHTAVDSVANKERKVVCMNSNNDKWYHTPLFVSGLSGRNALGK